MNRKLSNDEIKSRTLDYFRAWIENGRRPSDKRKQKIIELNLGLAGKEARTIKHKTSVEYEQLYHYGVFGLGKAVDAYIPGQGVFSTFSKKYIKGYILQQLRDKHGPLVKTPRAYYDKVSSANGELPSYNKAHKKRLSVEDLMVEQGEDKEVALEMVGSTKKSSVSSFDASEGFEVADPITNASNNEDYGALIQAIEWHCQKLGKEGLYFKLHYHPDKGLPITDIAKRNRVPVKEVREGIAKTITYIREAIAA